MMMASIDKIKTYPTPNHVAALKINVLQYCVLKEVSKSQDGGY
jgi:hypothetical protein